VQGHAPTANRTPTQAPPARKTPTNRRPHTLAEREAVTSASEGPANRPSQTGSSYPHRHPPQRNPPDLTARQTRSSPTRAHRQPSKKLHHLVTGEAERRFSQKTSQAARHPPFDSATRPFDSEGPAPLSRQSQRRPLAHRHRPTSTSDHRQARAGA
jgi:hypothetical protein